jgi:flagellar protein FlaG
MEEMGINLTAIPAKPVDEFVKVERVPAVPAQARLRDQDGEREDSEPVSSARVEAAAQVLGDAVSLLNRSVRVELDRSTDRLVTKIVDRDSNEVIKQIPPEELLAMVRRLREYIGLLLDVEI